MSPSSIRILSPVLRRREAPCSSWRSAPWCQGILGCGSRFCPPPLP
jgi:hypothetical protein